MRSLAGEREQPADHEAETIRFGEVQVVQHGQEQFPETRIREPRRPVVGQVGQVARLVAVQKGFIGQKKLVRADRVVLGAKGVCAISTPAFPRRSRRLPVR